MSRPHLIPLALALALGLAACGKDEPAPAPPPAEPAIQTEGPAETPPAKPGETAQVAPEKPATPEKPVTVAVPPPVPPEATPKGGEIQAISLASIPPEVGVVVGSPGLGPLVRGFAQAARVVDHDAPLPPDPLAALLEAARMRFGLAETAWIDVERPVRVVVPDQKANPGGFLVVLPVRAPEEMVRSGLGKRFGAAPGHAGVLAAEGGAPPVFVDFLPDHVVFSGPDGLWATLTPYVKDTVMAWTPPQTLSAEVSVTNLRRIYTEELAATRDLASAVAKRAADRMPIPAQARTLTSLVDAGFDFVLQADRLGVALEPGNGVARVAFGVRGADGTDLAKRIADHGGREADLLGAVAKTAFLGLAWDLPVDVDAVDPAVIGAGFSQLLGEPVSDADAAALAAHFKAGLALATGDAALSIGTDGDFPLALEITQATTDGAAAKGHLLEVLDWIGQRGIARLKAKLAEGGAAPENLKLDGFGDLVVAVNQLGGPLGLGLAPIEEVADGVAVSGIRLTVDWDRMALAKSDPALADVAKVLVGPRLEAAVASGKERVVAAFGPNAAARAAKLAAGETATGEADGGQPQLARVGAQAFFAVTVRIGALLQAFARLPSLAPRAAVIAKLPADEAFALDSRSDGKTTTMTLHVPVALLTALITSEW